VTAVRRRNENNVAVEPRSTQAKQPSSAPPAPAAPLPELKLRGLDGSAMTISPRQGLNIETQTAAEVQAPDTSSVAEEKQEPGANGTVSRPVLSPAERTALPTGNHAAGTAMVIAPFGLTLREAPHPDAAVLKTLPLNTLVHLQGDIDQAAGWREVEVDGAKGWVSAAFLMTVS